MEFHTILQMQRQGHSIWQAYMSSRERVLDTTMAVVRQRLGIEPPFFTEVQTQDATRPNGTHFFLPVGRSHEWRQSSPEEVYFRWNVVYYPWEKTPFQFHLDARRPDMVGFPSSTTRRLELEKFTILLKSYKRPKSLQQLLVSLEGLGKMDKV